MNIKRILLTGDDGYNSVGTRLLIHALKDKYELHIAATKEQQSCSGGKMSASSGGEWGTDVVDGVPALWVDGTPVDVMECAQGYFKEPFDLMISGVNLGSNVTTAVVSSGTYSAAVRGMGLKIAPLALIMSWDTPSDLLFIDHNHENDISDYLEYPGGVLRPILEQAVEADFWGVKVLNINLPQQASKKIRFTKILKDITRYYSYPILMNEKTKRYSYDRELIKVQETNPRYDAAAVTQGYISITPCAFDMTHFTTFEKLENEILDLNHG